MSEEVAVIALGSNLGDRLAHLRWGARALETLGEVTGRSSLYETDPVGGPSGQDTYLNAVVLLRPNEAYAEPHTLLAGLLRLEQKRGRERSERWAPRTLDLDLLTFGDRIMKSPDLTLPHPRMMARAFVLVPLCEVAPDFVHPVSGQKACEVLGGLETEGIRKTSLVWN